MAKAFPSDRAEPRWRRGVGAARSAWGLARGDATLAGLGLLVAVLGTLTWALVAAPGLWVRLLVVPLGWLNVLAEVALCVAAAEARAGRSCRIDAALAAARARGRSIAAYLLVAVPLLLALGALAGVGLAAAWIAFLGTIVLNAALMFAGPEIALQGTGGIAAARRSLGLFWNFRVQALAGLAAIALTGLLVLLPIAAAYWLDPPLAVRLLLFVAWGAASTLLFATWGTFAVILHREATGAAATLAPVPRPAPFWRSPLQRRAWIAWSTSILAVLLFFGAFVAAREASHREHRYDLEAPALAVSEVIEFPVGFEDEIHEGTGIYWYREAAGSVRETWVRGDALMVEVLLEPRFIPEARAGGFTVYEEDGSSWIAIIPPGLT